MAQNDVSIDLAALKEQIKSIASAISEIKSDTSKISTLDKTLSELSIHKDISRRDIGILYNKYDDIKQLISLQEQNLSLYKAQVQEDISAVDMKTENFINKIRGGSMIFVILGGTIQAAIFGVSIWVFSHVNEGEVINKLQQQKLELLEKRMEVYSNVK